MACWITPGGVSIDVALKRADQAIENYRGQAMTALRGQDGDP
ncbi:MAG: hypothetical protein WDM79_04160 [Terricaulis sp.]